jgi:hypothetical protein
MKNNNTKFINSTILSLVPRRYTESNGQKVLASLSSVPATKIIT